MSSRSPRDSAYKSVTIVGVGVIGGSLGLAIKKHFPSAHVTGVDTKEVLRKALKRGAIDVGTARLSEGLAHADVAFLATPVSVIQRILPRLGTLVSPSTLVTDVGSVKRRIVRRAWSVFPAGDFVGVHPMAGVELSGVDAAHPLLFENAVYVLSPMKS